MKCFRLIEQWRHIFKFKFERFLSDKASNWFVIAVYILVKQIWKNKSIYKIS